MTGPRRLIVRLAALLLVAVALTACGEDGEGLLPEPTRTPTVSPTRSITATPTRSPRPTESPSEAPSETPSEPESPSETVEPTPTPTETPEPTQTPKPTKTPKPTETVTVTETPSEEPSPTESATPTETPTPSETASPTESPSETPDAEEADAEDEQDPAPAWVWWLLALALVAAAVGIPLYLWSKRRRQWRTDLVAQEGEMAWLARTHLPGLRQKADTPDRVATIWDVGGEGRASAAEDHLTQLEATAPDDAGRARVRTLRDGVRAARLRLDGLEGATTTESVVAILDASIADLETALGDATGRPAGSS